MATTVPTPPSTSSATEIHRAHRPDTRRPADPPPLRGWRGKALGLVILATLLSAAVFGASRYLPRWTQKSNVSQLLHTVSRNDLIVTVTEDGNLESASNLEIKCEVAGGSSILWIVDDGSTVKKGDKLVELDASQLDEQINAQKITYEKARSAKIQAEKSYAVAKLSVQEYLEGTFKQSLQDAEAQITIAMENLRNAENTLEYSQRMFRKGYVSSLELESQRFAVQRSQLELDSARTARDVLVNFTKVKTLQDLESQRDTAEAQMKSESAAFELEEIRLKRLEDQLASTVITASQDGMVVYANAPGRFGQQQSTIEEGAAVRERQSILRLPDLAQMQVKVNVHESKVENIEPGMRARIRILNREWTGSVTSVGSQPEPTGFFSANVKEYATLVRIEGDPRGLRPGMTAEVEILVAHLRNVLSLPVAAVVQQRDEFCCWVQGPQGPEKRLLVLGQSNDQFIEVKDGVSEGDQVLLNPRSVVPAARATDDSDQSVDVTGRFGEESQRPPSAATGPPQDGPPSPAGRAAPPSGDRPPGPAGERRGPPGGRGGGNLMQLDQDGDGRVSRDEAPETMRTFFDRLDANGDGFIDRAESDAMRRRFEAGGGPGRPGGPDRPGGTPGPAAPGEPPRD